MLLEHGLMSHKCVFEVIFVCFSCVTELGDLEVLFEISYAYIF